MEKEDKLSREVDYWLKVHGVVGMEDLLLSFAKYFYELGKNEK